MNMKKALKRSLAALIVLCLLPSVHAAAAQEPGNSDALLAYHQLLKSDGWLDFLDEAGCRDADSYKSELLSDLYTSFYLYDIDGNGIDELLICPDLALTNAYYLLFSYGRDGLYLVKAGRHTSFSTVSVCRDCGALALTGGRQSAVFAVYIQMKDGAYRGKREYSGQADPVTGKSGLLVEADLAGVYVKLNPYGIGDVSCFSAPGLLQGQNSYTGPANPLSIYGKALQANLQYGVGYSLQEKIQAVKDAYYDRHADSDGNYKDGYKAKSISNSGLGTRLGVYYGDGLPFYVEVIDGSKILVKLYYWGDEIIGLRDYRDDGSLRYEGDEGFRSVADEFASVYGIAMQ